MGWTDSEVGGGEAVMSLEDEWGAVENSQEPLLLFQVRHNVRPYFLVSDSYKCVYDVITWACTQIAISYTVVPFVLLTIGPSLKFYR